MPSLPTHIVVQRLNHRAAFHIERDEYDIAIELLIDALRLWETVDDEESEEKEEEEEEGNCSCIDECILQSQELSPQAIFKRNTRRRRRRQEKAAGDNSLLVDDNDDDNNNDQDQQEDQEQQQQRRFIYRQPILITKQFWKRDSVVPSKGRRNTVSLILILNLAMAHHLGATMMMTTTIGGVGGGFGKKSKHQEVSRRRKKLQKALQLYELAHKLQLDDDNDDDNDDNDDNGGGVVVCSPQVTMIIANNVGEIHRTVRNHQKHIMCMNHLLSTMMYIVIMVDNNHLNTTSTTTTTTVVPTEQWDGFLRNITSSQLILKQNCAGAA